MIASNSIARTHRRRQAAPAGIGRRSRRICRHDPGFARLKRGNLYCALLGERVDGHRFVVDAADVNAAAALVTRTVDAPIAQIVVDDVVQAMGRPGRRLAPQSMHVRVAAITGSNGKTTVKTMLAAILRRCAPTLATRGNYNNEIGVPLTLAALDRAAPLRRGRDGLRQAR